MPISLRRLLFWVLTVIIDLMVVTMVWGVLLPKTTISKFAPYSSIERTLFDSIATLMIFVASAWIAYKLLSEMERRYYRGKKNNGR